MTQLTYILSINIHRIMYNNMLSTTTRHILLVISTYLMDVILHDMLKEKKMIIKYIII